MNQFVHKGDALLIIDRDRYRLALADAEAALAARHAQHLMALEQYEWNDLHRRDEGRRGASNRARHQESHGCNFWSAFGLRPARAAFASCHIGAKRGSSHPLHPPTCVARQAPDALAKLDAAPT